MCIAPDSLVDGRLDSTQQVRMVWQVGSLLDDDSIETHINASAIA